MTKFEKQNKASVERWTILKRYKCWKTLQFNLLNKVHPNSARKMTRTVQLQAWRVQLSN